MDQLPANLDGQELIQPTDKEKVLGDILTAKRKDLEIQRTRAWQAQKSFVTKFFFQIAENDFKLNGSAIALIYNEEKLEVLDNLIVRKVLPWALFQCGCLSSCISLSLVLGHFLGLAGMIFGFLFGALIAGFTLLFVSENDVGSLKYLYCRRKFKKLYGKQYYQLLKNGFKY